MEYLCIPPCSGIAAYMNANMEQMEGRRYPGIPDNFTLPNKMWLLIGVHSDTSHSHRSKGGFWHLNLGPSFALH